MRSVYRHTLRICIVTLGQYGPLIFGPGDLFVKKLILTQLLDLLRQFCFATPFYF